MNLSTHLYEQPAYHCASTEGIILFKTTNAFHICTPELLIEKQNSHIKDLSVLAPFFQQW